MRQDSAETSRIADRTSVMPKIAASLDYGDDSKLYIGRYYILYAVDQLPTHLQAVFREYDPDAMNTVFDFDESCMHLLQPINAAIRNKGIRGSVYLCELADWYEEDRCELFICDRFEVPALRNPLNCVNPLSSDKGLIFGEYLWNFTPKEINLSQEHKLLLVVEAYEKQDKKLERLRNRYSQTGATKKASRERIPDDVQSFVWRRDNGRCVKCGSQEKLEFDHIIPVSKGGGNTNRNIQLLCEPCNRSKGASI